MNQTFSEIANRYSQYIMSIPRIERKFYRLLVEVVKQQNIKLVEHDTLESLNQARRRVDKSSAEAAGFYRYRMVREKGSDIRRFDHTNQNEIHIKKYSTNKCYTLAHELGHHFSLKWYNDGSEEVADSYVEYLGKQLLPNIEYNLIKSDLKIYSGQDLYYQKDTPIKGKQYFNMYAYVLEIINMQNYIKNVAIKELRERSITKNDFNWFKKLVLRIFY